MSVRRFRVLGLLVRGSLGTFLCAGALEAQDFWLVPDGFAIDSRSTVAVTGLSGTPFPKGTYAVRPSAVADARLTGVSGQERIFDRSFDGRTLRLRRKPGAPGQYIVAASLKPRTARAAQTEFLRYLREQGAAEEAARLSRETAFRPDDSVTYRSQRFATVIVDVGSGPKAYNRGAGYPIDFIPQSDPAGARHLEVEHRTSRSARIAWPWRSRARILGCELGHIRVQCQMWPRSAWKTAGRHRRRSKTTRHYAAGSKGPTHCGFRVVSDPAATHMEE